MTTTDAEPPTKTHRFAIGRNHLLRLAEILGQNDPGTVADITLAIPANGVITATIVRIVTETQATQVTDWIEEHTP